MTVPGVRHGNHGPLRLGVVLRDPLPWPEMRQVVQAAEDGGYEAVFVPEIAGREAFTTLTGFAMCTSRLRLGTGVVSVWSRSPLASVMAAATVHELSGGRMILGLGAGSPPATELGSSASAVERVRHYVRVVREGLSGKPVGPDDMFGAEGFVLGLDVSADPPPVWLGALGDRMIRLAGELADGVILNWCTPERVAEAATLIREAAENAGRDPAALTVAVYVRACLGVEEGVALRALKPMAGQYAAIPHYLRQFERMGLGEVAAAAAGAFKEGRPDRIPDGFVRTLAVTGARSEALARLEGFRQAGADLVLSYPVAALERFSSLLGTVLTTAPSTAVER